MNLPQYTEINKMPDTPYNNVSPLAFTTAIVQVYEEMVTWRENLFLVPTGKVGKTFIKLISEWLNNFNIANSFQVIAVKVVMILPNLLLQKPSSTSKSKEHSKVLEANRSRRNKDIFQTRIRGKDWCSAALKFLNEDLFWNQP